jgi:HAD superfamily hydrolase (TIGR01509 family)
MQIAFPNRDYAGYIFDLDGTLIDSMPVHYRAWLEGLRGAGFTHEFGEDFFYSLGGVPTARIVEILNARHGTALEPAAVAHAKEEIYLERLPEIPRIEPVVSFARARVAAGRPIAIASGGARRVVDAALRATGLRDLFPIIVTPEDVTHGKPSPEMFLFAAARMGVPAGGCLVLEDAEPGRQAAVAAGMDCVMVPGRRPENRDFARN